METKPEIKVAKGTKVTRRGTDEQGYPTVKQSICYADCIHEPAAYANSTGEEGGNNEARLYLSEEGRTWIRGWTGKAVTAFKRAALAEERKRKLDKAKQDRKRDEEHTVYMVKHLCHAADIVKRAKLPRELRAAAFTVAAAPVMMGPWMTGR